MTLNIFAAGVDTSRSSKMNQNQNENLILNGLNTIRQIIDRSITFSKGGIDGWGEGYGSQGGTYNSVQYDSNFHTAIFETNKYTAKSFTSELTGTDHNPGGTGGTTFTNVSNAFDSDKATYATFSRNDTGTVDAYLGKTFTSRTINYVKIKAYLTTGGTASHSNTLILTLQKYDGASWTDVSTLYSSVSGAGPTDYSYYGTYSGSLTSCQGLRLKFTTGYTWTNTTRLCYLYEFDFGTTQTYSDILHTIPTGTYSSTISKLIGVPLIIDWETGANIQFKLTNTTEDTGWCTYGTLTSFTTFTSEPTSLYIRLTPKSSSPTFGYPSIYGSWVRAI